MSDSLSDRIISGVTLLMIDNLNYDLHKFIDSLELDDE